MQHAFYHVKLGEKWPTPEPGYERATRRLTQKYTEVWLGFIVKSLTLEDLIIPNSNNNDHNNINSDKYCVITIKTEHTAN